MREVIPYCPQCGKKYDFLTSYFYCTKCGHPLDIAYDNVYVDEAIEAIRNGCRGLHCYASVLPFKPLISLGEAQTPQITQRISGVNVVFKLENLNPTGSFKDRGACLACSHALMLGFQRVLEDSSGNTGLAVASYSRALGMESIIVVPEVAPHWKKRVISRTATVVLEYGDRFDANRLATILSRRRGDLYYVNHLANPLFIEAAKTIVYELIAFSKPNNYPDFIIVPAGSLGLLIGVIKGLKELNVEHYVRVIAVQNMCVCPLYEAFHGIKVCRRECTSIADGIMVPNPPRLQQAITLLKEIGTVVVVDDSEIIRALRLLTDKGIIVEPTSATGLAALLKMIEEGEINYGDEVVVVLTGSGLKVL